MTSRQSSTTHDTPATSLTSPRPLSSTGDEHQTRLGMVTLTPTATLGELHTAAGLNTDQSGVVVLRDGVMLNDQWETALKPAMANHLSVVVLDAAGWQVEAVVLTPGAWDLLGLLARGLGPEQLIRLEDLALLLQMVAHVGIWQHRQEDNTIGPPVGQQLRLGVTSRLATPLQVVQALLPVRAWPESVVKALQWQSLAQEWSNMEAHEAAATLAMAGVAASPAPTHPERQLLAIAAMNTSNEAFRAKHLDQARQWFAVAQEQADALSGEQRAVLYFNGAQQAREARDLAEALALYEQANHLTPQTPRLALEIARTRYLLDVEARGYQFTTDFFSHNLLHWQALLAPLAGQPRLRFLEVGSWEGRSTCWLLDHILTDDSSNIVCVDTFEGSPEHHATEMAAFVASVEERFNHNTRQALRQGRVIKQKGTSQTVLRHLPLGHFDVAYIDASHTGCDVLEDAMLTWRLVKPGGLIVFNDYGWTFPDGLDEIPPKPAIDAVLSLFAHKLTVLHQDYQVVVRKLAD
jgi:predicted O-methyltransferase YrrM